MDDPLFQQARTLKEQGLAPACIAKAMFHPNDTNRSRFQVANALAHKNGLGLSAEEVAKVLHDENGLNLPISDVAWCLWSRQGLDLTVEQVARVLAAPNGLGLPPTTVASFLCHKLPVAFRHDMVAQTLAAPDGLGLPPLQVAKVLAARDGPNLPVGHLAWCLYSSKGLALSAKQVAQVLASPDGLSLAPEQVAKALCDLAGMQRPSYEVAKVLHDKDGLDLPLHEVARALHAEDGCRLSLRKVASVLAHPDGLGLKPDTLVPALAAVTTDPRALFKATVACDALCPSTKEMAAMVEALLPYLPSEHPLPFLAQAFLKKGRTAWSLGGVVRFFHAKDGLDLPPQTIVYALTHPKGPCLPLPEVAALLVSKDSLALSERMAHDALRCGAGLSPTEARDVLDHVFAPDSYAPPPLHRAGESPCGSASPVLASSRTVAARV